ncbi:S28 family serine protease [Saccharothrix sp. ST-888]|uniref:S28 family serine protease n=1 Tax=Saccharothrix sp. ST-888 TaxID=1427391 RepID=UPI0007C79CCC|nr:S28 family serine protease [Saccharothrix sp. ST-888]
MRNLLRGLLAAALLIPALGLGSVLPATAQTRTSVGAATTAGVDIRDRLAALPGVTVTEEKPAPGYRYFLLTYTQPVDHFKPWLGTFQQRFSVLHRGEDRPTVFYTNGYTLGTTPSRTEPTRLLDGNQVSIEYRYFTPSRPVPTDWTKAGIRQGAADAHAIIAALKRVYGQKWISTGASKGGMSSVYHRRFYPNDVDGTVAYVAPNEVNDRDDSAYTAFFQQVGTPECRTALRTAQRELLVRRNTLEPRYAADNAAKGNTFEVMGSADRGYEAGVLDVVWSFWQYATEADCATVPPVTATDDQLYTWFDAHSGITSNSDGSLAQYTAYYYQAGTELGAPSFDVSYLKGLLHYDYKQLYAPRSYVPRSIPMHFDPGAMRDIDHWVRQSARRILFVYGANDPWGAERFTLGRGSRDSYVYTVPGGNHGSKIAGLTADESAAATAKLLAWAGAPAGPSLTQGHQAPSFGALDAEGLRLERNRL